MSSGWNNSLVLFERNTPYYHLDLKIRLPVGTVTRIFVMYSSSKLLNGEFV